MANIESKTSIKNKFKTLWKYYIFQSFLAAAALFVLALLLQKKMVLISAMGATAFIVFTMPKAASAQTKNVIGGHLIGLSCGAMFYFTKMNPPLEYALAVGLAIFIMVALDLEHPPAAGTALAVVINEVSFNAFVTIMLSAVILSQMRYYLRTKLKDLI